MASFALVCVSDSIQPTYEELKPSPSSSRTCCSVCIQPTYEELKPNLSILLFATLVSIQPTYEELKHGIYDDKSGSVLVSSLPMRN